MLDKKSARLSPLDPPTSLSQLYYYRNGYNQSAGGTDAGECSEPEAQPKDSPGQAQRSPGSECYQYSLSAPAGRDMIFRPDWMAGRDMIVPPRWGRRVMKKMLTFPGLRHAFSVTCPGLPLSSPSGAHSLGGPFTSLRGKWVGSQVSGSLSGLNLYLFRKPVNPPIRRRIGGPPAPRFSVFRIKISCTLSLFPRVNKM